MRRSASLILPLVLCTAEASVHEAFCGRTLLTKSQELKVSPQELLVATQQWQRSHFEKYPSKFSMDFYRAVPLLAVPENAGTDVVSFGAGADLYTPFISFPMADRIHLVDLWDGWGKGAGHVLWEIVQRARHVHPTAKVEILDFGFTRTVGKDFAGALAAALANKKSLTQPPIADFAQLRLWRSEYPGREHFMESGWRKPLKLKVSWQQEHVGELHKEILIHALDFTQPEMMEHLKAQLGGNLAGVVVTGIGMPPALLSVLYALPAHAAAVLEVWSDFAEDVALLELLKTLPYFEVRLANLETVMRFRATEAVEQRLYVVRRRPSQ
jgi:hypothetical protein